MDTGLLVLVIVIILCLVGIVGTFLPLLPGVPIIFISIAAYGWYEGFQTISPHYLIFLASLTILSVFLNYLGAVLGAKHFGSSKAGVWGAVIGTIVGVFFFPPLGIFLGPWLGAFIAEYSQCKDLNLAWRAGIGAVIGLFTSVVFNCILALVMTISFLVIVF